MIALFAALAVAAVVGYSCARLIGLIKPKPTNPTVRFVNLIIEDTTANQIQWWRRRTYSDVQGTWRHPASCGCDVVWQLSIGTDLLFDGTKLSASPRAARDCDRPERHPVYIKLRGPAVWRLRRAALDFVWRTNESGYVDALTRIPTTRMLPDGVVVVPVPDGSEVWTERWADVVMGEYGIEWVFENDKRLPAQNSR